MAKTEQPEDLHYAQSHEWVRVTGTRAYIGISDYAQDELGDVIYLDLPWGAVGSRDVRAGEHFGDIESVKATSELFSPVSGRIVEVNERLRDAPELVNTDPYGHGWMLAVELTAPDEVDGLMDAAAYTDFLRGAGH